MRKNSWEKQRIKDNEKSKFRNKEIWFKGEDDETKFIGETKYKPFGFTNTIDLEDTHHCTITHFLCKPSHLYANNAASPSHSILPTHPPPSFLVI